MHNDMEPVKKRSFRRLSFFKQPQPQPQREPHILMTHTINKEYDVETGNKIINNFMIIKEIGRGVHGKVKLAEDLDTGELVAIKIVDKQSRKRQLGYNLLNNTKNTESELKIRREIAILKKCQHPNVVKLKEVIDDPKSRKIYLALEYMEGGEIIWREDDDSNQPILTLQDSRNIFRNIVSGLDYLHYQGIIHRDIKPANLLLSKDHIVKISDFGVSYFNQNNLKEEMDKELAETAGTPAFFAPELCSSIENITTCITKSIDIWALGVTLYCFIFGQCPFTANTEFELFDIIPTQPLSFPFQISDTLQDLLLKLLEKDPLKRITLDEVKHHPWVIEDLRDPNAWYKEADPTQYKAVEITDLDVHHAVTIMDKLRKSIHRISSSILSSLSFNHHHQPKSYSSEDTVSPISSIYNDPPEDYTEHQHGWIPTSFTKMTLSSTTSSSDEQDSIQHQQPQHPFQIDRNESSSSSMSGLVVAFSNSHNK